MSHECSVRNAVHIEDQRRAKALHKTHGFIHHCMLTTFKLATVIRSKQLPE